MTKVYVNAIYQDNEVNIGVVVLDKTIHKDLPILFTGGNALKNIRILIAGGEDFHVLFRFCQFVVYFQRNNLGVSIKLYDFEGNIDKALEEYRSLEEHGWGKEQRDKIMKIVQEIEDNPNEIGEIIIEDPVPMPSI